jgi:hypothetical protein
VKIAFVVGFMDPVRTALNDCFPEHIYQDRLIWIPQGNNSLEAFKGRLYNIVKTAEGVLVCLGRPGPKRFLEDAARGIIRVAQQQNSIPVQFQAFGNIFDATPVIDLVKSFGIDAEPQIEVADIRKKVTNGKILCVSLAGKTSVLVALQRAKFSHAAIAECFEEEIVEGGKNSNLNSHLKSRAGSFPVLIYAWEGARTSTSEVKTAFAITCVEAQSAAQVVELFKKWVMDAS